MYAPDVHESLCLFTAGAGLLEGKFAPRKCRHEAQAGHALS